jgi:hypothetical protein
MAISANVSSPPKIIKTPVIEIFTMACDTIFHNSKSYRWGSLALFIEKGNFEADHGEAAGKSI